MSTDTTPTSIEALAPRYKIGYRTDEWGERSSTPGGIPDPAGAWVRYDDHAAALARAAHAAAPKAAPAVEAGGPLNELEELNLLNKLIELGARAANAHAASNSDDGHKGTAAYVQWQELRSQMGDLIRAAYAAPTTQAAPVAQGDALPREEFAWMVVQEACETEPADEDDPECIRILRRDLKSAVLAAFLREDAARMDKEGDQHGARN